MKHIFPPKQLNCIFFHQNNKAHFLQKWQNKLLPNHKSYFSAKIIKSFFLPEPQNQNFLLKPQNHILSTKPQIRTINFHFLSKTIKKRQTLSIQLTFGTFTPILAEPVVGRKVRTRVWIKWTLAIKPLC